MNSVFISTATSTEESERAADVAVLPIGSFEQHGSHLPLATDTLIASAIAGRIARDYELFLLPPITFGCSHEHSRFSGTVSISAKTLYTVIDDVMKSLRHSEIFRLVIINGHGGNYVLSNIVQEANVAALSMILFPRSPEWVEARKHAGVTTDNHEDMHGGEAETSILLAEAPNLVRSDSMSNDYLVEDRRHLLTIGIDGYAQAGVIGKPSMADPVKGRLLLESFSTQFREHLALLS